MRYLIALFLPFLAMFMCGKMTQGIICLILQCTLIGWLPATIWAFMVVSDHKADKRMDRMAAAIAKSRG
jgi:uncharacterized membrane protein YqaE (UPF0057 family)